MSILCTQYEYIPFTSKESQFIYLFLFHSCKINMKFLDHLVVYKNIDYLWYLHLIAIV
jgi:hypothetical protein